MANRAYAGVWCRDFRAETMLLLFEGLLGTVPFSKTKPGFTSLVLRAVSPDEAPIAEHDLRMAPLNAAEMAELAKEWTSDDAAFEAQAFWDMWAYDSEAKKWEQKPLRVEILCYGPEYDGGTFLVDGQMQIDAGFEHLFTGHGGLLSANGSTPEAANSTSDESQARFSVPLRMDHTHPAEAEFLERMRDPTRLREYQARTQENIRKLLDWMDAVQKALPVERLKLWSEGEEEFEGRLDEILARD